MQNYIDNKTLVSDTVFKYFIKNKDYQYWFYEIIEEKTGIDLRKYHLTDNEENTGNKIKDFRMDVVFESENKKVIVEMNNNNPEISDLKGHYYLHRVQGSQMKEGENYKPKTTTLIMFNNYKNPKTPNLAIGYYKMTEQITKVTREDVESYEIALPLFHKNRYNEVEGKINKRLWIMGAENMENVRKQLDVSDENLKIIEEYERLVESDSRFGLLHNAEREQKMWMHVAKGIGYNEGVDEGKKEGVKQANLDMAKKMLSKNKTFEEIEELTNLSLEEIKKLAASHLEG